MTVPCFRSIHASTELLQSNSCLNALLKGLSVAGRVKMLIHLKPLLRN